METAPPQAATPRVHFLCADSGLGKTTALAEFARRATDAGQPTAGILCPLGEDGLRKMVCLRTGEERPLQMVPLTEADAAQRKERLDTTDARTRETMSSAAAEASAAEPYSPTLAQNLAQTLTRSFSPATPHPNPNQANHWLTDDAAATPAGAIAAVPLPRCPDPDLNPEPDHTAYALNIHTARHTHTAYAQHTHCRCAVSRRRCAPISRRSCRAPPLASEERPSSPTHSRAP